MSNRVAKCRRCGRRIFLNNGFWRDRVDGSWCTAIDADPGHIPSDLPDVTDPVAIGAWLDEC